MGCVSKWLLCCVCTCGVIGPAASQELRELSVSTAQLAAMGVQFVAPKPSGAGVVLVTGAVTTPPSKQVTLSAPYMGQMSRMLVGVGDEVTLGTPLGYFTSPEMAEARRQHVEAASELALAREALRRDQTLFDDGIIPEVRLQVTRARLATAEARFNSRAAELKASGLSFQESDTYDSGCVTGVMKSPMRGVVLEAHTTVGQKVDPGTLLFKIADVSTLMVEVSTSADKAKQINVGDEVRLPQKNGQGKVIGVSKSVDASQAAKVRIAITRAGNARFGDLVSLVIHTKGPTPGSGWMVPSRSLTTIKNRPILFASSAKGVSVVPVEIMSGDDDMSLVRGQMTENSKIATTGIASLKALALKED